MTRYLSSQFREDTHRTIEDNLKVSTMARKEKWEYATEIESKRLSLALKYYEPRCPGETFAQRISSLDVADVVRKRKEMRSYAMFGRYQLSELCMNGPKASICSEIAKIFELPFCLRYAC